MYRPADNDNGETQTAIQNMKAYFYDEDGNYIAGSATDLSQNTNNPTAALPIGKNQYYLRTPVDAHYIRVVMNGNNTEIKPLLYAYTRVSPEEHLPHTSIHPCHLYMKGLIKESGDASCVRWRQGAADKRHLRIETNFSANNTDKASATFTRFYFDEDSQEDVYRTANMNEIQDYQDRVLSSDIIIVNRLNSDAMHMPNDCIIANTSNPVLILEYCVTDPELIQQGEKIFQITPVFSESSGVQVEDLTTRDFLVKFNLFLAERPETGTRYELDERIKYELVEELSNDIVWSVYHDDLEFNIINDVQCIRWMPHHIGHQKDQLGFIQPSNYILRVSIGTKIAPVTLQSQSYVSEVPELKDRDDIKIALRLKGENLQLTDNQYMTHNIGEMYGTEVTLWWTNPTITHASGLRVNFQILIAKDQIPTTIEQANILTILPDPIIASDNTKEQRRFFPGATTEVSSDYTGKNYKTFFCYNTDDGSVTTREDLPYVKKDDFQVVFGEQSEQEEESSQGQTQGQSGEEEEEDYSKYLYGYRITNEQIENAVHPSNYSKIFFSIRPVIEAVTNADLTYPDTIPSYLHDIDTSYWRAGSEFYPAANECRWQHFYYINDFQTKFCSDLYWDENLGFYIGDPMWRTCRMLYCYDEEEKWIQVFVRYYDDKTEQWKQC